MIKKDEWDLCTRHKSHSSFFSMQILLLMLYYPHVLRFFARPDLEEIHASGKQAEVECFLKKSALETLLLSTQRLANRVEEREFHCVQ